MTSARYKHVTPSVSLGGLYVLLNLPAFLDRPERVGWIAVNLVIGLAVAILSLVVHEGGHALTARLAGLEVHAIFLGRGSKWAELRLGGITLALFGDLIWGATVVVAQPTLSRIRLRMWLTYAAGPLASYAVIAASGMWARSRWPITETFVHGPAIGSWLRFWGWVGLTTLIPSRSNGIPSDGYRLLTLPFAAEEQVRQLGLGERLRQISRNIEERRFAVAEELLADAKLGLPGHVNLELAEAQLESARGQPGHARQRLGKLLERRDLPPPLRGFVLNSLAWCSVLDRTLLDDADRQSAEALELCPGVASIRNTRGAVLLRLGRTTDAAILLEEERKDPLSDRQRALVDCLRAELAMAEGRAEAAEAIWATARSHDPDCALLPVPAHPLVESASA
jgi:hypothetical protein